MPGYQTAQPPLAQPVQAAAASTPTTLPAPAPGTIPSVGVLDANSEMIGKGMQSPKVCRINYKTVQLAYEITDAGPSGTAGVEVWYTRDGHTWQKFDGIQKENPCWVELQEGIYGITLLAKTGLGGGKEPPQPGDQPQMWIEVDLTKPVVFVNGVTVGDGSRTLNLTWSARDENFGRKPINLLYAERSTGPWMPLAMGVENTGAYTWQIPPSTPNSFLVRVEATDLAGNVGTSETPTPIQIDLSQPQTTNLRLGAPGNK